MNYYPAFSRLLINPKQTMQTSKARSFKMHTSPGSSSLNFRSFFSHESTGILPSHTKLRIISCNLTIPSTSSTSLLSVNVTLSSLLGSCKSHQLLVECSILKDVESKSRPLLVLASSFKRFQALRLCSAMTYCQFLLLSLLLVWCTYIHNSNCIYLR